MTNATPGKVIIDEAQSFRDPIRARLDDWQSIRASDKGPIFDALRAVLDLCDWAIQGAAPTVYNDTGWGEVQHTDIRRVIAEHLGVTDA